MKKTDKKDGIVEKLFETIHLGQKILHFNVPIEIVDEINLTYQNNVKDLKNHNQYLAGKIVDEHKIDNLLSDKVKKYYDSCFRVYLIECKVMYNINLVSAWVNEMKASEYNPMHHHTGQKGNTVGLSSVMMLKKPDTYGKEYSGDNFPTNGNLEFNGNGGGMFGYNQCKMDTKVGDLLIFPYDLRHGVYPFNSTTECRRTISYNCDLTEISQNPI